MHVLETVIACYCYCYRHGIFQNILLNNIQYEYNISVKQWPIRARPLFLRYAIETTATFRETILFTAWKHVKFWIFKSCIVSSSHNLQNFASTACFKIFSKLASCVFLKIPFAGLLQKVNKEAASKVCNGWKKSLKTRAWF